MNEHIEHFKRFSSCYLMWSHSNFDRIASDAARKQLAAHIEKREEIKRQESSLHKYWEMTKISREAMMEQIAKSLMIDNIFVTDVKHGNLKIGSTLKIKLPSDYVGTNPAPARFTPIPLLERARTWLRQLNIRL